MTRPGAPETLRQFLEAHPEVGAAGPRLLNRDGSLQFSCRRFPRPIAAVFRNTPLGKLFPRNRYTREYLMTDCDHTRESPADWISGAAMCIRRETWEQVGGFDEGFFMYAEDMDWCLAGAPVRVGDISTCRARRSCTASGAAATRVPLRMVWQFHRSMARFYRKHYAPTWPRPVRWLPFIGVWIRCGVVLVETGVVARQESAVSTAEKGFMKRSRDPEAPHSLLLALHDAALLLAVFLIPIYGGAFNTNVTMVALGQQATGLSGVTLITFCVSVAALSALAWRWMTRTCPGVLPERDSPSGPAAGGHLRGRDADEPEYVREPLGSDRRGDRRLFFALLANGALLPAAPREWTLAFFILGLPLVFFTQGVAEEPIWSALPATFSLLDVLVWLGAAGAVALWLSPRDHGSPVRRVLEALAISAGVMAVWVIREKAVAITALDNPTWRCMGTFANPNALGGFFALVVPADGGAGADGALRCGKDRLRGRRFAHAGGAGLYGVQGSHGRPGGGGRGMRGAMGPAQSQSEARESGRGDGTAGARGAGGRNAEGLAPPRRKRSTRWGRATPRICSVFSPGLGPGGWRCIIRG